MTPNCGYIYIYLPTHVCAPLPEQERFQDHVLGRVKVPALEVAASGRLRGAWPLQGALMGELELALQWIPASCCTPPQ
jgi:hypothetical protein